MRLSLHSLCILIGFLLSIACNKTSPKEDDVSSTQPNILLIVSEDNGAELGSYGVTDVKTPVLDKFAEEGVRFERAYVTYSVCSPSRGTIYTSLYPHQNGQIGLATHKFRLYRDFKTLPVYLKEAGYRTGCLGKIHVNPESAIPFDFRPIKSANFAKLRLPEYAERSAEFINASDTPFFLMVNFPDAHFPLQRQVEGMPANPIDGEDVSGTLPFVGADSERLREYTANYYNSMNRLDESVGMLLDKLDASGKRDNTVIIYLGDHGAQFSRGKCSNYEGGLKIPLIVQWPEHMLSGSVRDELISTIDLLPSILEGAGVSIPDHLPGRSFLPLLKEGSPDKWRDYIYADGAGSAVVLHYPRRSIRGERFKLISNLLHEEENPKYMSYATHRNAHFDGGTEIEEINNSSEQVKKAYEIWRKPPPFELYDLKNDPWEFNNLSDDPTYKEELDRLKAELLIWQIKTKDPFADKETFNRYNMEVKSIAEKYPKLNYARDPEFKWEYPNYFKKIIE